MKCYNVMLNGCVVGTAATETEGLYQRFRIRCKPPDMQMYRLIVLCGSQRMDLGVCVPEDNLFVMNKRVQSKLLGEGDLQFHLEIWRNDQYTTFVPIDPQKSFDYLDRLPDARFEKKDGVWGLILLQQ